MGAKGRGGVLPEAVRAGRHERTNVRCIQRSEFMHGPRWIATHSWRFIHSNLSIGNAPISISLLCLPLGEDRFHASRIIPWRRQRRLIRLPTNSRCSEHSEALRAVPHQLLLLKQRRLSIPGRTASQRTLT
mmetsp:Transcript_33008/g.77956  ORF Transcript_33008/g.77956 Transcript_33008/m.77956 type:complete len:131 (+) Transcript_33008:930-1322(+)